MASPLYDVTAADVTDMRRRHLCRFNFIKIISLFLQKASISKGNMSHTKVVRVAHSAEESLQQDRQKEVRVALLFTVFFVEQVISAFSNFVCLFVCLG